MNIYNKLKDSSNIPHLFLFGMYRSGTTVIARSLAGEKNIAFASDTIRPFFNFYRTKLQKEISCSDVENSLRPLGDYFNSRKKYLSFLQKSNFSETISKSELIEIRSEVIKHSLVYSPKFKDNLENFINKDSAYYKDELKFYLDLIFSSYGNEKTSLIGLKEVWSIEMALPILNMMGDNAKILVILRDPLDITASSLSGSPNYSILSLARQWRKQIVFYNFLKKNYPEKVELLNYEEFCNEPTKSLKDVIQKLVNTRDSFFSFNLNPIDDFGNIWIKNSSYSNKSNSQKIDKKSIGKFKNVLNNDEIEWIKYLTHMWSYRRYNYSDHVPPKPKSPFPKRNVSNVAKWAKFDLLELEGDKLEYNLKLETQRVNKIQALNDNSILETELLTEQI